MPDYYFCNGETKKKTPCQNHVSKEGDRCRHHQPKGSRARKIMDGAYKAGKNCIVAASTLYGSVQAYQWLIDIATHALTAFNGLLPSPIPDFDEEIAGIDARSNSLHMEFMFRILRERYSENEEEIKEKLELMDEKELEEFSAMCNFLIAQIQYAEETSEPEYLVAH